MKSRDSATLLSITFVLFVLGPVRAVHADNMLLSGSRGGTILSVDPLKPFAVGDQPSITVHLATEGGKPLAKSLIRVFNYKNRTTLALTDGTGTVHIPINFYFRPGSYPLLVAFDGSAVDGLNSSAASVMLTIVPATLQVQTVPPMAGVQFSFNSQTETTDSNGVVEFNVDHIGGYQIEATPPAQDPNSKVKVVFSRWENNSSSPGRTLMFVGNRVLQASFLIYHQVSLKYTDEANQVVDPARISLTRVRAAGTSYSLTISGPLWLPSNYILHPGGGSLQSMPTTYFLDSVTIAGANVVNAGEQRFQPNPGATWWVRLFLYSARFRAQDAIFRSPIGSGILLQYPNGARQEFAFDPSSDAIQVNALPRGSYHASVLGAQGLQPQISLNLSSTQEFNLVVLSRLDMAVLVGVPALALLILLVIRRVIGFVWLTPRRRLT